jgi:hypothetical protein
VEEETMRLIDADAIELPQFTTAFVKVAVMDAIDNAPTIETKPIKYFDEEEKVWKVGSVIVNE